MSVLRSAQSAMCALALIMLGSCSHGVTSFEAFQPELAKLGEDIPAMNVPFVPQKDGFACGAAALTSVMQYWGGTIDQTAILADWHPAEPTEGYSIGELRNIAQSSDFKAFRLLENEDYLFAKLAEGYPIIAPIAKPYEFRRLTDWMIGSILQRLAVSVLVQTPYVKHYVVLIGTVGAHGERVVILDPQDGYLTLSRDLFVRYWRQLTENYTHKQDGRLAALIVYHQPKNGSIEAGQPPTLP